MANAFSQEEVVAFEKVCEGFEDALVLSRNVSTFRTEGQQMSRSGDTIWRPMPYIANTNGDGLDQTSNFRDNTQLSVPATLGYHRTDPFQLNSLELRDKLRSGQLGEASKQKLASDINVSVMNVAANEGTLVVARPAAAVGFVDVAECEAVFNEQGVPHFERYLALSTRDYNGMAANLANRSTMDKKVTKAYEKAYVGEIASYDTYKLDYANSLVVAAGINYVLDGANQRYVPAATSTAGTGETSNVDNRYQDLTIDTGTGVIKAGDCFTIAGVNAVNHITKMDTGFLKTFRVKSIVSGGGVGTTTIKISPPIIAADSTPTDAELQYKNVTATPADTAAVSFTNIATARANPFWQKDAIELLPGTLAIPSDSGAAIMRATTENGIEMVMQKQYDINTSVTKFRFDVFYGVVMKQPEMAGVMLFGQT